MRNQKRDFKIRALDRENAKNSFSIHATPGNSELAVQSSDVTGPNADSAANGKCNGMKLYPVLNILG